MIGVSVRVRACRPRARPLMGTTRPWDRVLGQDTKVCRVEHKYLAGLGRHDEIRYVVELNAALHTSGSMYTRREAKRVG